MKTIMIISPQYLEAIFTEAKKYSFVIQGYGTFKLACKGVTKVVASELLGVAFVADNLPREGSKEYESFIALLNLLSSMNREIKFSIVLKNNISNEYFKIFKQYDLINFYGRTGVENITNTLIGQNVFGSLILSTEEPYALKEKKVEVFENPVLPTICVDPLISPYLLQCVSDVAQDDEKRVLRSDSAYLRYVNDENTILASMRKFIILKTFGKQDDSLLEFAKEHIETGNLDTDTYVAYSILYKYVEDIYGTN